MNKMALLVGAVIVAANVFAEDNPVPMVIGPAETLDVTAPTNVSSLTVHGRLNVIMNHAANDKLTVGSGTIVQIAPDLGDIGVVVVSNACLRNVLENNNGLSIAFGSNGGGDQAKYSVWLDQNGWAYLGSVTLSANARTDKDVFDVIELGTGSHFRPSSLVNANVKPMQIDFIRSENGIDKFWDGDFFKLTGGGDVILNSVDGSEIHLRSYHPANSTVRMFAANPKACVRIAGTGNVRIDAQGQNAATFSIVDVNATNFVWGSGDLVFSAGTAHGGLTKLSVDDVLPYGAGKGDVTVRSAVGSYTRVHLDLCGTTQHLNSLANEQNSVITNSSATAARLVFGTGDTDGSISGSLACGGGPLVCEKVGSGTLTLQNATVDELVVTGGVLQVAANTVNRIGKLTVRNAVIFIDPSAVLDVTTWDRDETATVVTQFPTVSCTNEIMHLETVVANGELVKDGPNYLTCMTPVDAQGMNLRVKGGVLRMGGAECTDPYWRIIFKKAMVDSHTYTDAKVPEFSRTLTLGLGVMGIYSTAGRYCIGALSNAAVGTPASSLAEGQIVSAKPVMPWALGLYQQLYPTATSDPILQGGSAWSPPANFLNQSGDWFNENTYDAAYTTSAGCHVSGWSAAVLFTNGVLKADDPATWETLSWRMKSAADWPNRPASYNLMRFVNNDSRDRPHPTDWEIQTSPTGEDGTWVTLDVRTNQNYTLSGEGPKLNPQFNFTYNAHVPYLFSGRNASWTFNTFGTVSVAAGAMLDLGELRDANIAFNALEVDLTAGAGTITKFRPAANGKLFLVNLRPSDRKDESLVNTIVLPLTLGSILDAANLDTWTVYVDGELSKDSLVKVIDGKLVVKTPHGLMILIR